MILAAKEMKVNNLGSTLL